MKPMARRPVSPREARPAARAASSAARRMRCGVVEEDLAGGGERDVVAVAVEEGRAKFLFELPGSAR